MEENLAPATDLIVCEICGNSVSRFDYDRHLRTHKEKRVETCQICLKSFTSKSRILLNFREYKFFLFLDLSNFKYHMAHHGNERPWLCNECPKNYKTKIDLLQHQRVHDKARDPFQCNVCGNYFKTRSNLNSHLRSHTPRGPQKCNLCDKLFINLRSHIQMVHHKVRKYICSVCSKPFGKKSGLDRHVITVHEKKRCWECDLCEKSFGEKAQLVRHRKIHFRPIVQEPDPDQVSDDQEIIEDSKRKMKCGTCKKVVNSKAALKRHKLLVHEKQKNLLCDFCPKMFGEAANLRRHILTSHKVEADEVNEGSTFPCSSCSKELNTKRGLNNHEKVCRIHQEKRLNNFEEEYFDDLSDAGSNDVEQVFLPGDEMLSIKQEPIVDTDNLSNEAADHLEPLEVMIKLEPEEEDQEADVDEKVNNEPLKEEVCDDEDQEMYDQEPDYLEDYIDEECVKDDVIVKYEENVTLNIVDGGLKKYECNLCQSSFKELRYFKSHYETVHTKNKRLTCNVGDCSETFVYRVQRMRHIRQKHPEIFEESDDGDKKVEQSIFECEICKVLLDTQMALDLHFQKMHSEGDDVLLEDCEVESETIIKFSKSGEETSERSKRTCTLCTPNKIFKKFSQFLHHTDELHVTHQCLHCQREFTHKRSLERHIKGVHDDIRDYECNEDGCTDKYRSSYALKQHQINYHNVGDKSDRTCTECEPNRTFKKPSYLTLHQKAVHFQETFQCPQCDREFSHKRSLERHIKGVHEDVRDYPCSEEGCGIKFRDNYTLNQHRINEHNKGDKSDRTCSMCTPPKVFKKVKYCRMHMESIHNTEPKFFCPICKRGFSFERSMTRHVKAIHEDRRDFKCSVEGCEKAFRSSYELKEHCKNIHEEKNVTEQGSFACELCEKVYLTRKGLYTHTKFVHEGVRWGAVSSCKLCKEVFDAKNSKYWKNKHWIQVHRNGEVKVRTCHVCSTDFQLFEDYKAHIISHFGYFICVICGHNFPDESALFMHSESHRKLDEDVRQYICDVCSHRLSTKPQLRIHMRKHFSQNYYICDVSQFRMNLRRF